MAEEREIIGREVLVVLLVGDLEDTDSVIAEFDRNEKHVTHYLVQLLVHRHVITQLVSDILVLRPLEMPRLPSVEDLAEDVGAIGLALEGERLAQPASDDLAEQLVFDAIIEED